MTLPQLDEVLAGWNSRLAAIADNLLELENEPAYRMLSGGSAGSVRVTGLTAARVEPALKTIPAIYVQFSLLREVVDRAVAVRRQLPMMFGGDAKLAELHRLLFTRSVTLPATEVPLAERSLLTGTQRSECCSPDELLAPMTRAFTAAKDAVLSVSRAWGELAAELDRTEMRMRRLGADADADRMIAETKGRIQGDPLGALEYLRGHVEPVIAGAERKVAARAALEGALRGAHAEWEALVRGHGRALEALAELRDRFGEFASGCVGEEQMTALRGWLGRLEERREDAAAVTVGLRNWSGTCAAYARVDAGVCAALEVAVGARRELKGRLDALKAKARVYGVAEVKGLAEVARAAEGLLGGRPVRLGDAAVMVAGYEERLRRGRLG